MQAVTYMSFAILMMSLYPLVIIYGAPMGPFTYTLMATTFSSICALAGMALLLKKNTELHRDMRTYFKQLQGDDYLQILLIGLCNALTHVFFLFSLQIMSSAGAAVIFEFWPILAMFLSTLIISKKWEKIRPRHYIYSLIGLSGVILISLSDPQKSSLSEEALDGAMFDTNVFTFTGAALAIMAAVMSALFVVFRIEFSNKLKKVSSALNNDINATMIGEAICRVAALPPLILATIFVPDENQVVNLTTIASAAFIGIVALYLTNMAFTMAVLKSKTPTIKIMWYFVPAIAVIWLNLFGISDITPSILIGMLLIISANALVAFDKKIFKWSSTAQQT